MLSNFIFYLVAAYWVLAFAAGVQVVVWDLPRWFDRATAYGDGKLHWTERLMLAIYAPGMLAYVYYYDKWPGTREFAWELYVTIVLGRQYNSADAMRLKPYDKVDDSPTLWQRLKADVKLIRKWWAY